MASPVDPTTQTAALPFHVMAKPVGSTCNLDCTYCYYLSKETLAGGPATGRMSDEVLERFIQQYIAAAPGSEVVFSWQGGEPTLLGLGFFRKVVALEKKHARPGQKIQNDLQTNGTLLDEEWCAFLKEHRFLVGLSIDAYSGLCRTVIPISVGQGSDFCRTAFRFLSDRVPGCCRTVFGPEWNGVRQD